jgi:predicted RNase H-like HicB family nuclease
MEEMEFEVVLIPQPEGGFTVSVPDLPGVITEGETREEALEMARDAIELYLSVHREKGWPIERVLRERIVVRLE